MYSSLKILHQVQEQFSLKAVMGLLLHSYQPIAEKQHSVFVNDIPGELDVKMDKQIFCMLMSNVLLEVLSGTRDACLHVFADSCDDYLIIGMTDGGSYKGYAVFPGFVGLMFDGRLCGVVDFCKGKKGRVAFCFSEAA